MPRTSAPVAYSTIQSGVRCAETTLASCGTPKRVNISSACRMVSQSDLLPMTMPTRGCMTKLLSLCQSISGGAVEAAQRLRLHDFNSLIEDAAQQCHRLFGSGAALGAEAAAIRVRAKRF